MDSRRLRFFAALGVFFAWVAFLGVMAAVSGQKPSLKARVVAPR